MIPQATVLAFSLPIPLSLSDYTKAQTGFSALAGGGWGVKAGMLDSGEGLGARK